jgi:hypothetical protein
VSFALNLVLIVTKVAVVIRTGRFMIQISCQFLECLTLLLNKILGSISLIASAVDSVLDILSGLIIFITTCLIRKKVKLCLFRILFLFDELIFVFCIVIVSWHHVFVW